MGCKQSQPSDAGAGVHGELVYYNGDRQEELEQQLIDKSASTFLCPKLLSLETRVANFNMLMGIIAEINALKESERRKSVIVKGIPENVSQFIQGGQMLYHRVK